MENNNSKENNQQTTSGSGSGDLWIPDHVPFHVYVQGLLSSILISTSLYASLNDYISLHPNSEQLYIHDYTSKLEFLTKYQAPNLLLIILLVFNVIYGRLTNFKAVNPLVGNEHIVQKAKNILTNTFEQYIIYIMVQLMLLNYLEGPMVPKVVPVMCWLFFIGRIAFVLGYPIYRTFGWVTTTTPTFLACIYGAYKFLEFTEVTHCVEKYLGEYLTLHS